MQSDGKISTKVEASTGRHRVSDRVSTDAAGILLHRASRLGLGRREEELVRA